MALNGLFCAGVPLRNYSLIHSLKHSTRWTSKMRMVTLLPVSLSVDDPFPVSDRMQGRLIDITYCLLTVAV